MTAVQNTKRNDVEYIRDVGGQQMQQTTGEFYFSKIPTATSVVAMETSQAQHAYSCNKDAQEC